MRSIIRRNSWWAGRVGGVSADIKCYQVLQERTRGSVGRSVATGIRFDVMGCWSGDKGWGAMSNGGLVGCSLGSGVRSSMAVRVWDDSR